MEFSDVAYFIKRYFVKEPVLIDFCEGAQNKSQILPRSTPEKDPKF